MINERNGLPVGSIEMFEATVLVWLVLYVVLRVCGVIFLTQTCCGNELKESCSSCLFAG